VNRIGITAGDPSGIGAELIVKIAPAFRRDTAYILYGTENLFKKAARMLKKDFSFLTIENPQEACKPGIYLIEVEEDQTEIYTPSLKSARMALTALARATVDAVGKKLQGILTMPLNKHWAKKAGFAFEGQTEYLANACGKEEVVMVMFSERIKVALLTTHIPLRNVPFEVTQEKIKKKLELILGEYSKLFKNIPTVGVLGLNPHAGENGEVGTEELTEIIPVVRYFREKGFKVEGPLSPDSAFINGNKFDLFLCMYHDQGLIPFKILAEGRGVNITLGLPFIRTSPAHGTAHDIAWKGKADPSSALKALELLHKLIQNVKE